MKKGKQKKTQVRVDIYKEKSLSHLSIRSVVSGAYPDSNNQLEGLWRWGHLKLEEQRAALK